MPIKFKISNTATSGFFPEGDGEPAGAAEAFSSAMFLPCNGGPVKIISLSGLRIKVRPMEEATFAGSSFESQETDGLSKKRASKRRPLT
jgi:hypothetical protein